MLFGRPVPTALYRPELLAGLQRAQIRLPDYDGLYNMISVPPGSPLAHLVARAGAVRIPVPADLRARAPLLAPVRTRVTRTMHSQTPHIDFPHPSSDPRRYNLFWAETPRQGACTYFIPAQHGADLCAALTDFLCGNTGVWDRSAGLVARGRQQPAVLSRYPLPDLMLDAFEDLTRHADDRRWQRLSAFGQTTIAARVLGNTTDATRCVEAILGALGADRVLVETWDEPLLVVADDTRFFHGRLGHGDSGGAFFRVWLSGPPTGAFSYLRGGPLHASA